MQPKQMSPDIEKYFKEIERKVKAAYDIASKSKKIGYDPEDRVDIPLAKNMAERVEGLIAAVAPQIADKGMVKSIFSLEEKYGKLDWRVALSIALDVAQEKFCKFKDQREAMETGIRVGLAYLTLGIVASPLEGFVELKLKKTKEGKEYFCLMYSGPIRSAGGTAGAVSVLVADYIRKKFGYAKYDPSTEEIQRLITELYDYHERVTNLQYLPSENEIEFLIRNLPVQIDGDPSEKIEVSNYKDLERIETNRIRSGPCLVIGECMAQKAKKVFVQLSRWGADFDLQDWGFIEKFIELQKKVKAQGAQGKAEEKKQKIAPIYTYISDLVAGRPVLTHPLETGGFRLRYGRSRSSGYSSAAIHPATTYALNKYIAIGTQLKVERPGKAAVVSTCDSIDGPIVKLDDGSVLKLDKEQEAKEAMSRITEILFLGDILFSYGDFFNRAHTLLPAGYCEEWWIQELEKKTVDTFGALDIDKLSELVEMEKEDLEKLFKNPLSLKIKADAAIQLSKKLGIPLYPRYSYYWKTISAGQLGILADWLGKAKLVNEDKVQKLVLPLEEKPKRVLELLGVPHLAVSNEHVVIEKDDAKAFLASFGAVNQLDVNPIKEAIEKNKEKDALTIINLIAGIKIRDKAGIFIGARMGRPEKAKIRKLTGSPNVLFPVGGEGGKMRSFQSALEAGKISSDFPIYKCIKCDKETIFGVCEQCSRKTTKMYHCNICGLVGNRCKHGAVSFRKKEIDINYFFDCCLKKLNSKIFPDLIKGVRGTSNKEHIPEHLIKGILRAKHNVHVNKDGTIRYDMTQMAITHFKAKEIGTPIEKLRELGYEKDIKGNSIENDEQVIELKPQDIILPSCQESPDEGADKILFRVASFIDELLASIYNAKPFYNLESGKDLIGHLVIALAPHTSAATVGRIIGFSRTQGFYAHPMLHAATRRDCFAYDTKVFVCNKKENRWFQTEIGKFVESFNPTKKADNYGTLVKELEDYYTISFDQINKKLGIAKIDEVSVHTPTEIIEFKLEDGKTIKLTSNHKLFIKGLAQKKANELKMGDQLVIPYKVDIKEKDIKKLNLFEIFKNNKELMVRGNCKEIRQLINSIGGKKKFRELYKLKKSELDNYLSRDSFPATIFSKFKLKQNKIGFRRDRISIKSELCPEEDFFYLLGLYTAEGFARKKETGKGYYQISIAAIEKEIRDDITKIMKKYFGLKPSESHEDHLTYSSRILYELFVNYFKLGANAHKKNISFFLELKKEKLSYLLRGYLDGDGSVSSSELRVVMDTVSQELLDNLSIIFKRYGIYTRIQKYTKKPGPKVRQFYIKKGRDIPKFEATKLIVPSKFVNTFASSIGFKLKRKQKILGRLVETKTPRNNKIETDDYFAYPKIIDITHSKCKTYCFNVNKNHNFICNGFLAKNCDGDEASISLLMDALLNFSRQFLPNNRGATQDAPLVLSSRLIPAEVDDMVFDMDIAWKYPLEFYDACEQYKQPWEVGIEQLGKRLNTEGQYESMGFTHDTTNINAGVRCSDYKLLPSMEDKLKGQMILAERIRAVDAVDVARLVIEKHFLRDIKGNLRKFSQQEFRCVNCNEKYRRPPLVGKCIKCGGKIIFTISEGSIVKYLEPAISLAEKYNLPAYIKQTLELTRRRIEGVFGREKEKQAGLGKWF